MNGVQGCCNGVSGLAIWFALLQRLTARRLMRLLLNVSDQTWERIPVEILSAFGHDRDFC